MTIRRPWKLSVANRLPLSCRNSQQPYLGESGSVIRRALLIKRGPADFSFFFFFFPTKLLPGRLFYRQFDDVLSRNCLISFFFSSPFFSFLLFSPKGAVFGDALFLSNAISFFVRTQCFKVCVYREIKKIFGLWFFKISFDFIRILRYWSMVKWCGYYLLYFYFSFLSLRNYFINMCNYYA